MDVPVRTPPRQKRGAAISLGRRYVMAAEMGLAILPDKSKVPKGLLDPLIGHYSAYRVSNKTTGCSQRSDRRRRGARPLEHTLV